MKQNIFLVALLSLLVSLNSNAQMSELTNKATLIVQGKVISKNSFWNQNRTRIFTENEVLVSHVFKGTTTDSIISIVTVGGEVDDYFQFQTHTIDLQIEQKGYFLLTDNNNDQSKLRLVNDTYGACIETNDLNPRIHFQGEVYYKKQFENEIIQQTLAPKVSIEDMLREQASQSLSITSYCEDPTTSKSVNFSFDNVQFSDDFSELEFDVMAQVNIPGLYFGRGNIIIAYTEEFGSSVIANQTVEIFKGSILQSEAYSIYAVDETSQSVSLSVSSDFNSGNYHTFSSSPESLFRIKLDVADITQIGSISFDDISISGQVFYWCRGSYHVFDNVDFDDPISSTSGNEVGITYTFENIKEINESEVTVDIFAAASDDSYFSDALLFVNYNEFGFGENVVTNGTANFIQDGLLENSSIYFNSIRDVDNNTLEIVISSFEDQLNSLSSLSSTPTKLGTLSFEILDCEEDKGLSFHPNTSNNNQTYYTGNYPIPKQQYDPIVIEDEDEGKICACPKPEIESFAPMTIPAGNGDILTINGNNFGQHSSDSNVWFKDGDDGGSSWMRAHPIRDFLWNGVHHWTDTKIEVLVPSVDAEQSIKRPAASGTFRVENECGDDESDDILVIPYALMNRRRTANASKIALPELDDGGLCFTYQTTLPDWIKIEFKKALDAWCPLTEPSFYISDTDATILASNATDGINVVIREQVSSANGKAALLFTGRTEFCTSGSVEAHYITDVDIQIDPSYTDIFLPTPADRIDMRNALKHELGHVHMINHAIIPNVIFVEDQSIVYYSFTATSSGGNDIDIKPDDIVGANLVFPNSNTILGSGCGSPIQKSIQCGAFCSEVNATEELNIGSDVIIFPNPTGEHISIRSLDVQFEKSGLFTITDNSGRIVLSKKCEANTTNIEINLDLPSGAYFIKYQGENGLFTKKLIVQ